MSDSPEYRIQCKVAGYLDSLGVLWSASSNGMKLNVKVASKLKRMGYKAGYPDLFIFEPRGQYHGLAIEVKSPKGVPTKTQKEWAKNLRERGYYAHICQKTKTEQEMIDQIVCLINKYLCTI